MLLDLSFYLKVLFLVVLLLLSRRNRYSNKCKLHSCSLRAFSVIECGCFLYCPVCHGEEKANRSHLAGKLK